MEVRGIGRLQSLIVSLTSIWRAIMLLLPGHNTHFNFSLPFPEDIF